MSLHRDAEASRPPELPELTSARGVAAAAVVLYHIDGYARGAVTQVIPTWIFGGLAVDFFFILSGFVLTHVYGGAWAAGRYRHGDFLIRRLARIWPLHVACLTAVAVIVIAGGLIGLSPPWTPSAATFLQHAALLNAVGLSGERGWNQPSWSVGAEWTAYLAFPAYLAVASALRSAAAKIAAAGLAMAAFWYVVGDLAGEDLFELDRTGALRIVPSFFAGVVLRQIFATGVGSDVSQKRVTRILIETVVVLALGAWAGAPKILLWPGLGVLVYALALKGASRDGGFMRARPMLWFGEASYALYLVHAPVLMLTFGVGGKLLGVQGGIGLLMLGVAGAAFSLAAAAIAHHLIERPAQKALLSVAAAGSGRRRVGAPKALAERNAARQTE